MASDIWLRTITIMRKETRCCHIGYSYWLTARVLLYAPSHRQDNTYHSLCYTSRGALAGTRNSSMGSGWDDDGVKKHFSNYTIRLDQMCGYKYGFMSDIWWYGIKCMLYGIKFKVTWNYVWFYSIVEWQQHISHTHTHTHTYTHIHTYTHTHTHIHIHIYTYIHTHHFRWSLTTKRP